MAMGRRDAERTAIGWPVPSIDVTGTVAANFGREENTQAWLYYVFIAVAWLGPALAAGAAAPWPRGRPARRPDARRRRDDGAGVRFLPARQPRSALRRHRPAAGRARRLAPHDVGGRRAPPVAAPRHGRGAGAAAARRDRPIGMGAAERQQRAAAVGASAVAGGGRAAGLPGVTGSWPGCRTRSGARTWRAPAGARRSTCTRARARTTASWS